MQLTKISNINLGKEKYCISIIILLGQLEASVMIWITSWTKLSNLFDLNLWLIVRAPSILSDFLSQISNFLIVSNLNLTIEYELLTGPRLKQQNLFFHKVKSLNIELVVIKYFLSDKRKMVHCKANIFLEPLLCSHIIYSIKGLFVGSILKMIPP